MRLRVDGGGFLEARDAYEAGNHAAALGHDMLAAKLAGFGAMAGDASLAATFAAAYDDAATHALAALGDVVDAFASCGHLTAASLVNHRVAESRSIIVGATVFEGGVPSGGYVTVLATRPPSSLGGDLGGLPDWATWLLDQVEGFVWPDADVSRLRDAAAVWRTAGDQVDDLATYCSAAARHLSTELSPEVPIAIAATTELESTVRRLATECAGIATACDGYADQVEAQRAAILDLVHDMIRDAVIIQGIGIVLGVVSGGITAAGAAAVNAAKIAAATPRLLHLVSLVRAAATASAAALRSAGAALSGVRLSLTKFRGVGRARLAARQAVAAERAARLARLRAAIGNPRKLTASDLRGLSPDEIADLCKGWQTRPARSGDGIVYVDPTHRGRQIRVMEGYVDGNRPDALTHGPYAVVSQNGAEPIHIPLLGNGLL